MKNQLLLDTDIGPDAVARRAEQIWEAEGRPEGLELELSLRAEAELRAVRHRRLLGLLVPDAGPGFGRTLRPTPSSRVLKPSMAPGRLAVTRNGRLPGFHHRRMARN
jgi:hypothetical protein